MNDATYYRAIDLLSRPSGITNDELQEQLGISRRSVYRLLERLEDQGFPIYPDDGPDRRKRWRLEEHFLTRLPNTSWPDLGLNRQEVILLNLMLGSDSTLEDSEFIRVRKSLSRKLTQWMEVGDRTDRDVSHGSQHISSIKSGRKCYIGSEQILDDLLSAIHLRRICKTRYYAFSKRRELEMDIHPLRIFEWRQGFYVFCLLEPDLPMRMLALERFRSLEQTDLSFKKPDVDPEALLEDAFAVDWSNPIRVKIWFSEFSALYVKARRWSSNQSFNDQDDGSTVLKMTTSGGHDILHWVLSFGDDARVLEPESLVEEMKEHLAGALELYG